MPDLAILGEYDARLREAGVPVDEWALPGLSDEQIREALAGLGLALPAEARVWWAWRNGERETADRQLWRPWRRGLPLEQAVAQYRQSRAVAKQGAEGWDDKFGAPSGFPSSSGTVRLSLLLTAPSRRARRRQ
jgi:hypothetical protein